MTIQQAMDKADRMKPNMMTAEDKIGFLSEIEGKIHEEIIMTHEHTAEEETRPEYDSNTARTTEMLVPAPYDMIYVYWLMAQIDHVNQEMDKYNNDRSLFEDAWGNFADYWNRTRMPIQRNRQFWI